MSGFTVKQIFEMISGGDLKKDLIEKSGVSYDRITRLLDENNGGKLVDLIQVLESFGCELTVTHDGNVLPVKLKV